MPKKQSNRKSSHPNRKGKSMRNVPENPYGEPKETKSYSLTETAIALINTYADEFNLYASDVVERLARQIPDLRQQIAQDPTAECSCQPTTEVTTTPNPQNRC